MATQALITAAEFASLSIPTQATVTTAAGDIALIILRASAMAASKLSSRYTFPLVSWGEDLKGEVAAMTAWWILVRRGFNPDSPSDRAARMAYEDANDWLDQVARSAIHPAIVDGGQGSTPQLPDSDLQVSRGFKEWGQNGVLNTPTNPSSV